MPDTTRADAGTTVRPVAGRGKMTPRGYQPENHEYLDQLTMLEAHRRVAAQNGADQGDEEAREHADAASVRRIGRDPGTIPLHVLTAAGHPRCSAQCVVQRMNSHGDRDDDARKLDGLTLKRLRERYCYPCRPSEDSFSEGPSYSGMRNCDIIDCPVWPYRLGFNPHNPQRGIDPFAATRRRD